MADGPTGSRWRSWWELLALIFLGAYVVQLAVNMIAAIIWPLAISTALIILVAAYLRRSRDW